jgi:hypothetical protein
MLTLKRHRDLVGRERRPVARWIVLSLLVVFVLLGLLNLFGQSPETSVAGEGAAELELSSPTRVRGGLAYQTRFTIRAREDVKDATLVLGPGWLESITVNTVEPAPLGEASRDGQLALDLGHIPAGAKHVLYIQSQVNPTNVGRRAAAVDLYDGERLLAHIDRTLTVFP